MGSDSLRKIIASHPTFPKHGKELMRWDVLSSAERFRLRSKRNEHQFSQSDAKGSAKKSPAISFEKNLAEDFIYLILKFLRSSCCFLFLFIFPELNKYRAEEYT